MRNLTFRMKLDHLQLAMPAGAEEQARSFYSGILGMHEEQKPIPLDARGGCWFRKGDLIIHLGVEDNFRPQEKAHPAFIVNDIGLLYETLKENGYNVLWDTSLKDRKRFFTVDPFGNRIEILRAGDGFSEK